MTQIYDSALPVLYKSLVEAITQLDNPDDFLADLCKAMLSHVGPESSLPTMIDAATVGRLYQEIEKAVQESISGGRLGSSSRTSS